MTKKELISTIKKKKSFLCIGLDTDITKIPKHFLKKSNPVFEFNRQIIDLTKDECVAYKLNTAFYEAEGVKGWKNLEKTINYINKTCPGIFTIADAKRGDIGNTSKMYARAFFENLDFDAVTVTPYMGEDSVSPFLEYKNKWVILLALTSNKGAEDFQISQKTSSPAGALAKAGANSPKFLFEEVIEKSSRWGTSENMMYVVGATKAEMLRDIRKTVPDHFLLVPGVGAQGGSLQDVAQYGMNKECGLLVNVSRGILYAGPGKDFAEKAKKETIELQKEMMEILFNNKRTR